jgi:hypothetical protein
MPLDSDLPNADSHLNVEFYVSQAKETRGRQMVRIQAPGDRYNIIDTFVRDDHKERFPRQWLHFMMQNGEAPVDGTPLKQWRDECPEDISDVQLQELNILKFQTVEQVATASDGQVQRIGMGGEALRSLARAYLKRKRIAAGDAQSQEVVALKEQVARLTALVEAQSAPARKPGRPSKAESSEAA